MHTARMVVTPTNEAADALAYCHHTIHLLHRDLKPANIFLSGSGRVKIGDFGISRVLSSTNAMAKTMCGTPLFMSPELAGGKPYDATADVWALGCCGFQMALLREPWQDRMSPKASMMELMRLISTQKLDLSPLKALYSSELYDLLAALLSKQPSARPSCKALLLQNVPPRGRVFGGHFRSA